MQTSEVTPLVDHWQVASAPPGLIARPAAAQDLAFVPAAVPGTAASAAPGSRYDDRDWIFRTHFAADAAAPGERLALRLGGLATVCEVWLNGECVVESDSMFAAHEVDLGGRLREQNELVIICRSLLRALKARRPRPRWRTKVVVEQQLRWFRTTMLGRAPGFAPQPEPVGPWRPVELVRYRRLMVHRLKRQVDADRLTLGFHLQTLDDSAAATRGRLILTGVTGTHTAPLDFDPDGEGLYVRAELHLPHAERWWPHTHGTPHLYQARVELVLADGQLAEIPLTPVGFRAIESTGGQGVALQVNGTAVFCRGVIWTPPDATTLNGDPWPALARLRDAGFNMVRVAGTMFYEDDRFHHACDALGLLVWQDMMFANMDYPFDDAAFHKTVTAEARAELTRLARHASTAVLCGNSEIDQQAGMLGLDPAMSRASFFAEQLPLFAKDCGLHVPYIPSAPCGGDLAFRTSKGVANYFGVGAYRRPLDDARRAGVRFASECLAFSHVPEPERIDELAARTPGGISPVHPEWKRGVPRDAGAGWDFEDVRDHYLRTLYQADALDLRYADLDRYWELSRAVTGEVMAEVFGEWRRGASPCQGGIILWGADIAPGAGWGILDHTGAPKACYWFLRRALQPLAIWTTDEGLDGIDIHVANDGPAPVDARLRVALYRDNRRVAEGSIHIALPAHGTGCYGSEYVLGRFADAAYAYRFGPRGHDVAVASLYTTDYAVPYAQAFRFLERPFARGSVAVRGDAYPMGGGRIAVDLCSPGVLWGARLTSPGFAPDDMYFALEPGVTRRVILSPLHAQAMFTSASFTAFNLEGRVSLIARAGEAAA